MVNAGYAAPGVARAAAVPPPPPPATAAAAEKVKEGKFVPPSPPRVIKDRNGGWRYTRVGFLGEGGFARVYEVQDQNGNHKAIKVVAKQSIRSKKNKTKLWAEIKLHQMLSHPHIVAFEDCFEDEENVYMVLELCEHGSMMDLLRRRKRYTEAETRYYVLQIIAACQYMHSTNVIHRDLKLGNLFLDAEMNIKVGDFGLAALIEKPGDRKKTICGTPNYIAPEVLFDTANGHSFEVDVWSVGVILYTLLIGKPPFQTKDVKAIYKRIRENRYDFPEDKAISDSAKDLISTILNPNPDKRPTLDAILTHPFFLSAPFPAQIPLTANDVAPEFRHVSSTQSRRNFQMALQRSKVGVTLPILTDATRLKTALGPSILQQERDFKMAVQPNSPISALLTSARQPLVQAPTQIKEPSLLRKLEAAGAHATLSPARRGHASVKPGSSLGPNRRHMDRLGEEEAEEIMEEDEEDEGMPGPHEREGVHDDPLAREREVANQKARIVSGMTPRKATAARTTEARASPRRPMLAPAKTMSALSLGPPNGYDAKPSAPLAKPVQKTSLFDVIAQTLDTAMSSERPFKSPHIEPNPEAPRVFVISWLDYCTKYGMGFAMTDGTVSVHFNDSTSLVWAPGKKHFDHVEPASNGEIIRRNYPIEEYPRDLNNKVYLLKHFEGYMLERLVGNYDYVYSDRELTKGMVFVTRYLRMKHVILFRLSNDVLQFNFYDHTKLILSREGNVVSIIDKSYTLRTWSLEALLTPLADDVSPRERKRIEGVIHKLSYARDVLLKIRSHSTSKPRPEGGVGSAPVSKTGSSPVKERDLRPIRG
ncbi:kinase-like domain-containing protein [Kockovaella imperatae]|uniref:Serine/threonine-protein kinase n=1 Tax=Kockovaella imperatae TaxID=4999 RepID=A0A1Y1U6B9_9TREE|nr:kinase-like domain-containing protein [Kockovaella imperatae]ORX33581.1 kinase-like domain-containing protein [Kockovaella imperatae]